MSETTANARLRLIRAILKDWTCRNCGWLHLGVWRLFSVCDCCGFDIRYSLKGADNAKQS
jgi:hypothetical protein